MSVKLSDKGTILIVDDSPTTLGDVFDFLTGAGFEVLIARDGESVIETEKTACPDVILLDIIMRGIDGFETCRRLKAHESTKDIPVIFMTALSQTAVIVKGFQLGAVDYIIKPPQQEIVLARITTHLTIQKLQQSLQDQNAQLPLSLLLCDVDFFKLYNDSKGHQAGDECLQQVAQALKRAVKRPADLVARYGGEEFVVILPNTNGEGAMRVAEEIRLSVRRLGVTHPKSPISEYVTLSLGVSCIVP